MQVMTEQTDKNSSKSMRRSSARTRISAAGSARSDSESKSARRGTSIRKPVERKCIVTGQTKPADLMIRFVLAPDGVVVPDLRAKLEGRGVWVTATRSYVMEASQKGLFARGFRCAASVPEGLSEMIDALLERSCLDALGLARKAGHIIRGQAKVEAAARHKTLGAIVHASDGAYDGQRKIYGAMLAGGRNDKVELINQFTSNQLSLAFGMPNVIHAALPDGGIADLFVKNCRRLLQYREKTASGEMPGSMGSGNIDPDNLVELSSEGARTE